MSIGSANGALVESNSSLICHITLGEKRAGARSAGKPHAACDVEGAGNEATVDPIRARRGKPRTQPKEDLRATAPALDPTKLAPAHVRTDVAARIALTISSYRPVTEARRLRTPLLLLVCDQDSVAPIEPALEVARRGGPQLQLERYPIGHFDIYHDEHFDRATDAMAAFLNRVT